jgi:ACS family glucarate transporter-like MFS transporter
MAMQPKHGRGPMTAPHQAPAADPASSRRTHKRFVILALLFLVTIINYADRSTISIAGPVLATDLGISPVGLGYIFSAFAWSYTFGQLPGGWLLDRFGSKQVYFGSIFAWSLLTALQGSVALFGTSTAIALLILLRFLVGLAESPAFPANIRIVAAWFPASERGIASTLFASATYFASVLWSPFMGWLVTVAGWPSMFVVMGGLGIAMALVWLFLFHAPASHPGIDRQELAHIAAGGGLVDLDRPGESAGRMTNAETLRSLAALLRNRMMLGIYLAQYCNTALAYFFLTWFPVYLVKERGMTVLQAGFSVSLPALCGVAGGIAGGAFSDLLLRRGASLSAARKTPIVTGALCAVSIALCNQATSDWQVIAIMALAFFGKGMGAVGWAVIGDATPPRITGLSGGLFNSFANVAGIVTTIAIGYIVQITGSFHLVLVFMAAHAALAIVIYLGLVGPIRRLQPHEIGLDT